MGSIESHKRARWSYFGTVAFVALLLLSTQQAVAQVLYGSIVGNVIDPTQAAVPDATVTIIETNTGQSRTATTNNTGAYSFPTVRSGTYEIRVTKSGFQAYTESNVQVTINNVTRVDMTLRVGAVAETIVVSASAAMLQTDRSEVRAEMTTMTLENLPRRLGATTNIYSRCSRALTSPGTPTRCLPTLRARCNTK